MKKIVSNVLIVSTQLIVGGLFLFMLFSNKTEDNRVVVVENNNLDKMADAVSELFEVDHVVNVNQAEEDAKKAQEEEAARRAAAASSTSVEVLQAYAHDLVINSYGWTESDFISLVALWNRESGWRVTASSGSGAYGIPQALPGSKMASAGSDWATNGETQIRWGLNYIRSTYGSPSAAWAKFQSSGWY